MVIVHSSDAHLRVTVEFMACYVYVLFLSTTLLREIKQMQNREEEEKEEKRLGGRQWR